LPEDFKSESVSDDVNAAKHLRAAFDLLAIDPEDLKLLYKITRLPLTAEETQVAQRVIEPNRKALDEIALARDCAGANWGLGIDDAINNRVIPEFQKLQQAAWFLQISALREHEAGSDADSTRRLRDLLAMGSASRRMVPTLIPFYVGCGIDESAITAICEIAPDLRIGTGPRDVSAADIRRLIEVLRDERGVLESYATGWQGERAMLIQNIRKSYSPSIAKPMAKVDLARLCDAMDICREAGLQRDYPTAKPMMARARIDSRKYVFLSRDYLNLNYDRTAMIMFRFLVQRRMATVALAIALYRADHAGELPPSLDALVPTYLPALPADPYRADGKSVGYLRDVEWPVLYAWGENGRDDNASTRPMKVPLPYVGWDAEDVVWQLKRVPRPQPDNVDAP